MFPENFLVDESGYLKLCDFSVARFLHDGERAQTVCGTPQFLAPEVVLGKGYDRAADIWAFGITVL